jgi:tRNA (guanine37-N1)-methyltransferase
MSKVKKSKIFYAAKPGAVSSHRKWKGFAGYDVIGNIVIVKFKRGFLVRDKKKWALGFMREHRQVTTVLEKSGKFSGRLRKQKTKWIAGEKTREALYRENGCEFRLNVDSCYFSPRLSAERLEVAKKVKRGEDVMVMFGGIGVYAIAIGKLGKAGKVVSVELGRDCSKYAEENVKRNKLVGKVEIVQGDVRRIIKKKFVAGELDASSRGRRLIGSGAHNQLFDRIVMARPNLKDSFLDVAFSVIKKGGVIHYYGFYPIEEKEKMKEMIRREGEKAGRKVRIVKVKKAGEVRVKEYRWRVDLKIAT